MTKPSPAVRKFPVSVCAAGVTLCLGLAGCTSPSPKYDSQMGDALQRAKQAQTVLPTPAQRRTPAPAVTSGEVQRAVTSASTGQTTTTTSGSTTGAGTATGASGSSSTGGSSGFLR